MDTLGCGPGEVRFIINICMDYYKHYTLLINRAKNRTLTGYFERHHIVPRCMGGSDNKSNIVELTPEEHYVAHQLLVKIHPNNDKLIYAALYMSAGSKYAKRNNKRYGWLKRKHQEICKKRTHQKNPSYGTRWYSNFETKHCLKVVPNEFALYERKGYIHRRTINFSLYDDYGDKIKEKCTTPKIRETCRKLTKQQAIEIFTSDLSQNQLSKIYKVDRSTIRNIKERKTYVNVTQNIMPRKC